MCRHSELCHSQSGQLGDTQYRDDSNVTRDLQLSIRLRSKHLSNVVSSRTAGGLTLAYVSLSASIANASRSVDCEPHRDLT